MFWRAVEVIPETSPSLSPEFPVTTIVGSFLEMIGIGLSESPLASNLNYTSIVSWLLLLKIVILSYIFAFLPLPVVLILPLAELG
jgi:hypothetical protein